MEAPMAPPATNSRKLTSAGRPAATIRYLERQRLVGRGLDDLVPFPGEAYRQFV
jgi:hypothetical protein